jgi:hypothetical protein
MLHGRPRRGSAETYRPFPDCALPALWPISLLSRFEALQSGRNFLLILIGQPGNVPNGRTGVASASMSKASPFSSEESARAREIHEELLLSRLPARAANDLKEPPSPLLGRALLFLVVAAVHVVGGYFVYRAWWSEPPEPLITALPPPPPRSLADAWPAQPVAPPAAHVSRSPSPTRQTRQPTGSRTVGTSSPSAANRTRAAQPTASAPAHVVQEFAAPRALPVSAHADKAHAHAEHYFRYQHRFGSGAIHVSSLSVQLQGTNVMTGWDRYVTKGTVGVQYYDSAGRSSRRTTLGFEATTREANGVIEVLDFSVKSSSYIGH